MKKGKKATAKKKPEFTYLVNRQIRHKEVRLIGDDNPNYIPGDVYPIQEALSIADQLELDLVEVSPNAKPPVCRIVDVNKFKYEMVKKLKEIEAKQSKTKTKEIRLTPVISDGDVTFKLTHAKNFLDQGNTVRLNMIFKGRQIIHKDMGEKKILEFAQSLEDFGVAEGMPKLDGKRMLMDIKPKKKQIQ